MTESQMVNAILKVQILSSKLSNSVGKNISLQKDEIFVDLKRNEKPCEMSLKDFIIILKISTKIKNRKINKHNVKLLTLMTIRSNRRRRIL